MQLQEGQPQGYESQARVVGGIRRHHRQQMIAMQLTKLKNEGR